MIEVRPLASLGTTRRAEFEAQHHFCFAGYHAPGREGWGALCVLNRTILAPKAELRPQPLDSVDLISIVRKGAVSHTGSLQGHVPLVAGEVQLISSGPGVSHGDTNLGARPAELIEIRLRTTEHGDRPQRRTARFPDRTQAGRWIPLASGFPEEKPTMKLSTRARILAARLAARGNLEYSATPGRYIYVLAVKGPIAVNGVSLQPFEGGAIVNEERLCVQSDRFAEILLIDTE